MNDTPDSSSCHIILNKHIQVIKDIPIKGKNDILNWFFSLSVYKRVKALSITNSALSSLIQKMYMKYSNNSKTKFLIKIQRNDFSTYIDHSIKEDDKLTEKLFINEIRFCSIQTQSDTITLSSQLLDFTHSNLEKKQLFLYYLMSLSRNNLFNEGWRLYFDSKLNSYHCDLPSWYNLNDYYSIGEIMTAHFEQVLNYNYIASNKSGISRGLINRELSEFYEKRESLIQYVKEKQTSDELIQEINLKEVIINTLSRKIIIDKQQKKMLKKYFTEMTKRSFTLFEPEKAISSDEVYSNFETMINERKESIVDDLLFYSLNDVHSFEYYIAKEIIEVMKIKMDEKNYSDLINECEQQSNKKKLTIKKKKKKKKNKKDKEDKENKQKNENMIQNNMTIPNNNTNTNININFENNSISSNDNNINNKANDNNVERIKIGKANYYETINKENDDIVYIEDTNYISSKQQKEDESLKENEDCNIHIESLIVTDTNCNFNINTDKDKKVNKDNNQSIQIESNIQETFINNYKAKENHNKATMLTEFEMKPLNDIYGNHSNINNEIKITPITSPSNLQDKLHNEILSNCNLLYNTLSKQMDTQYKALMYLFEKIKQCFDTEIEISIYGSYSTGLQIESSDIDISIKVLNQLTDNDKIKLIMSLYSFFSQYDVFEELYPIITTSVPILRILLNPNKIITQSDDEKMNKIKIDLTFNLALCKASPNYVRATLADHIEIKPVLLMFKKLIKCKQLNNVFEGGLSSYSLFLMTTAYISTMKASKVNFNLGQYFLDMLRFYGSIFNYRNTVIDITKANPYIISSEIFKVPLFLDPITHINVSKSSYGFDKVQMCFKEMYSSLSTGKKCLSDVFLE